jgi:hypothetical protein
LAVRASSNRIVSGSWIILCLFSSAESTQRFSLRV